MDLKELIGKLAEHDTEAVVKALKDGAHPVFQEVFNAGHSVATAKAEEKADELETRAKDAETRAEKAESRVQELEESQPDVAKVREQYQAEIAELKEKHEVEMQTLKEGTKTERVNRAVSDLKAALIARGVDPEYAEIKVQSDKVRGRLRPSDGGQLEVLQEGKEIPFQPADGKTGLDLLADEIRGRTDAKWITSKADRGAGAGGGGGAGSGGGGDFYDGIREKAKKQREETAPQGPSAAERLSGAGAAP